MQTRQPEPFLPPLLTPNEIALPDLPDLPDLPEVPTDFCAPAEPNPSWDQQMAHAQMLLAWRKAQGLRYEHPPRNPVRFVLV